MLKEQLLRVPEIDLAGVDDVRSQQLEYAKARGASPGKSAQPGSPALVLASRFPAESRRDPTQETRITQSLQRLWRQARDAGLPVRLDAAGVLSPRAAETLDRGATDMRWPYRRYPGPTLMTVPLSLEANGRVSFFDRQTGRQTLITTSRMPRSFLRPVDDLRELFTVAWAAEKVTTTFNVVPVIVQVLQAENTDYRRLLVEELARIPGAEASQALARRALYDPAAELRQAARQALTRRPAAEFRPLVLKGFAYPWSPVADHAAQILLATRDMGAVPALVNLLDQPDPASPSLDETTKQPTVAELVRINHMRNCCLCHAPSYDGRDWSPGRVMEPGVAIPDDYYSSLGGAFVCADITRLRQDFSVMQPVENAAPWPTQQRYDFMVRTRLANAEEVSRARDRPAGASYPQREAMLAALRGLTGKDLGTTGSLAELRHRGWHGETGKHRPFASEECVCPLIAFAFTGRPIFLPPPVRYASEEAIVLRPTAHRGDQEAALRGTHHVARCFASTDRNAPAPAPPRSGSAQAADSRPAGPGSLRSGDGAPRLDHPGPVFVPVSRPAAAADAPGNDPGWFRRRRHPARRGLR